MLMLRVRVIHGMLLEASGDSSFTPASQSRTPRCSTCYHISPRSQIIIPVLPLVALKVGEGFIPALDVTWHAPIGEVGPNLSLAIQDLTTAACKDPHLLCPEF